MIKNKTPHLSNVDDSVLVIMDVQDRLVLAMPNGVKERVIERINVLLTAAKALSAPVILTEQYPQGLGSTVIELSAACPEESLVCKKTAFSGADVAEFMQGLEQTGRKQVVLVGMETHICILQTALALKSQGFQVFVVEDAVSSRAKANQYNALQRLRGAGVIITNVESVVFEWLQDAAQPDFKMLAQLIK